MKKLIYLGLLTSSVLALEFQPLGYESIGMGGAGVANASGSVASYYNPALLAKRRYTVEISVGAGIGIREINLVDHIDKLANDYDLTDTIDTISHNAPKSHSNTQETIDNINGALNEIYALSVGNGLSIMPTAEVGFQIGNFGLAVYGLGEASARAVIDRQHLYLIFKADEKDGGGYYYYYPGKDKNDPNSDIYGATDYDSYKKYSLEYALDNNLTYIDLNGLAIAEVPVSYATKFDMNGFDLSVGASIKYIEGVTYKSIVSLGTDSNDLEDELDGGDKESSNYGLDLGILISNDNFNLGLVGKYLNSPKFKTIDGYPDEEIKPMIRGGVNFSFGDMVDFAMDIDLTTNKTGIKGYDSQYIGGGINFRPASWFSLRMGAMRNMVADEEGTILTAGLGFGLKWIQFDIAAQASTETGTYDGNEIPRYMKVNAALISRWGSK